MGGARGWAKLTMQVVALSLVTLPMTLWRD